AATMTAPPENLADRPADGDQAHDLLSELLHSVRLSGERIVAHAPPPTFSIGFAETGCLHIVEEGELELRLDGNAHVEQVKRGDFVLLPRGDAHHISAAGANRNAPGSGKAAENGTPAPARWLCGT